MTSRRSLLPYYSLGERIRRFEQIFQRLSISQVSQTPFVFNPNQELRLIPWDFMTRQISQMSELNSFTLFDVQTSRSYPSQKNRRQPANTSSTTYISAFELGRHLKINLLRHRRGLPLLPPLTRPNFLYLPATITFLLPQNFIAVNVLRAFPNAEICQPRRGRQAIRIRTRDLLPFIVEIRPNFRELPINEQLSILPEFMRRNWPTILSRALERDRERNRQ